jgi:hypothetical protein
VQAQTIRIYQDTTDRRRIHLIITHQPAPFLLAQRAALIGRVEIRDIGLHQVLTAVSEGDNSRREWWEAMRGRFGQEEVAAEEGATKAVEERAGVI